jgi:organic radical activating enzyme
MSVMWRIADLSRTSSHFREAPQADVPMGTHTISRQCEAATRRILPLGILAEIVQMGQILGDIGNPRVITGVTRAMSELDDEYLSCEWAEGGLAFNRRSIHACLIVHHGTGYPFLADHNGGPLPIDDILRIRGEIRKANQSGKIHPECRGCAHLKRKRWLPSAYPINIVGIAHYSHCNIACNYCFLQTQDPSSFESGYRPYPILETIRQLYAEGLLAPDSIIDWGGGEPTVYREFEDILALTLEAGAFHYLHSNGVKLPRAIRDTPYAGRIHVICSVDAGLPETYQLLKKRDCLEAVWSNLAEYIGIGCLVTIKYIVREDNCAAADLEAFVARAAEIGAKDLIIDTDYDYPDPAPKVIAAVARLQYLAVRAHIHTRFGFTGSNFAVENDIGSRVQPAFESEQLRAIREFLGARGYAVSGCLDQTVEELVQSVRELENKLNGKELEVRELEDKLREKELEVRKLHRIPALFRLLFARFAAMRPWTLLS